MFSLDAPIALTSEPGGATIFSFEAPRFDPSDFENWLVDLDSMLDERYNTHLWVFNRVREVLLRGNGPRKTPNAEFWLVHAEFTKGIAQGIHDAENYLPFDTEISGFFGSAHYYNMDTNGGPWWAPNPATVNAVEYGLRYFQQALEDENVSSCGRSLGLAMHYLIDLTQPMHCGAFPNDPVGVWPERRHENYEGGPPAYRNWRRFPLSKSDGSKRRRAEFGRTPPPWA
jgi:hypothetical protein